MDIQTNTTAEAPKGKAKAPAFVPLKLLYDAWDEHGERLAAGMIHDLPRDFAARLLTDGKAERADPLPGA